MSTLNKIYENNSNQMVVIHNGNPRKKAYVMMYRYNNLPSYTEMRSKEFIHDSNMRLSEVESIVKKYNFKEVSL